MIPTNTEKYMSLTLDNLLFIDSFSFLATGLEKLVENLATGGMDKFPNLHADFPGVSAEKMKLLVRKGVFPYDYTDSFDKFEKTKLPTIKQFYNKLNNQEMNETDYKHAQNVWNEMGCKTFGDYHDLYLKTDVLLLADVFENFRKVARQHYKLDPCYYFSLPGYAWDAMLMMTKVKISLFDDTQVNEYLFVESAIRGGVSMITKRLGEANNKYIKNSKTYDESKPSKHMMYLDANNLYGWAMSQSLPVSDYVMETETNWTTEQILALEDDAAKGYIFEVDLEYPRELHELHNDLPCAPERLKVQEEWLSDYSKALNVKLQKDDSTKVKVSKCEKLLLTLNNREKYVVHYRNLKLYLQLGLKLTKVHKVMSFKQDAFLKPYVEFNTKQRALAKNDFEKDFFKLMNNACFGKTMENVRNRIDFELVTQQDRITKLAAKPRFKSTKIFSEDLVGVEMTKCKVVLNKPIIIGFAVLDMSKVLMYDFHYNTMKAKYQNKCKLLFTDTDSLCYEIETEDVYADMATFKDKMDFSDYPKDHKLYDVSNKKVIGKFKDETNGVPMTQFVGLKSKMYSFVTDDIKIEKRNKKRGKGIKTSVLKKEITHEDYLQCLIDDSFTKSAKMNAIRSYDHKIYSITMDKMALNSYDDKRYYLNSYDSNSYGYNPIKI